MTHREMVLKTLRGEGIPVIPSYGECPMDVTVLDDILPKPSGDRTLDAIAHAEFYGNSSIRCGVVLKRETVSKDKSHHRYRYETGAVWHESYEPAFCREALEYPINTPDDVFRFSMPDPEERWRMTRSPEEIGRLHDAGYFVEGDVMGAWFGIYYYLASFENILMWMALEPDAARRLFDMTSDFSLRSAKILLDAGVDAIFTASDLGSGSGLLFSKEMFRTYVFPWLKALADLCHRHGAYLHLHSHGHIQDIMDDIAEAGVDLLNPVGPSDHNDLAMFKSKWGGRIALMGGISTTIMSMTEREIESHVEDVMRIGSQGGRFFPRTESGIPKMSKEKTLFYLETLKRMRKKYGSN